MSRALAWLLLALGACGAPRKPVGPAPEYEAPRVLPWDAGAPSDPLDRAATSGWIGGGAGGASAAPSGSAPGGAEPPEPEPLGPEE